MDTRHHIQPTLVCRGLTERLRGLLGRPPLPPEGSCWIVPCASIHTFGMQYPIDVYFLDRKHRIVTARANVRPNRVVSGGFRSYSVIERPVGSRPVWRPGDLLDIKEPRS